jgi:hypothetical protein
MSLLSFVTNQVQSRNSELTGILRRRAIRR